MMFIVTWLKLKIYSVKASRENISSNPDGPISRIIISSSFEFSLSREDKMLVDVIRLVAIMGKSESILPHFT